MDPVINIDEKIGKTVGKRKPAGIFRVGSTKEGERAWARLFKSPGVPKGVFRFSSHEEADLWMTKMLARKSR